MIKEAHGKEARSVRIREIKRAKDPLFQVDLLRQVKGKRFQFGNPAVVPKFGTFRSWDDDVVVFVGVSGEGSSRLAGEVKFDSDDEELSATDWAEVKLKVCQLLQTESLDSPEKHLAYIREQLSAASEKDVR